MALNAAISRFLSQTSLKRLDLSLNNLGDESAMIILTALSTERRSLTIDFGANRVSQKLRDLLHDGPPRDRPHRRGDLSKAWGSVGFAVDFIRFHRDRCKFYYCLCWSGQRLDA